MNQQDKYAEMALFALCLHDRELRDTLEPGNFPSLDVRAAFAEMQNVDAQKAPVSACTTLQRVCQRMFGYDVAKPVAWQQWLSAACQNVSNREDIRRERQRSYAGLCLGVEP